ncbi:TraB/GumN family protein [Cohnella yongneupensis]|uniref:TraB/GumN family protein n=1 Tax=Cohnella yongneupensis TaxID=425006 RepID=A0ABW0R519_9BACL
MIRRYVMGISLALLIASMAACRSGVDDDSKSSSGVSEPTASASDSAPASSSAIASGETEPKAPGSKGFLWRVTGGTNPGYLAGTIHVARKDMYPLDPDLEQAVADSDYIGLELDLTKVNQLALATLVAKQALLTDGTKLQDYVSEDDYSKFEQLMKKSVGIVGASAFDQYEPWYAAMTLESLPATKYKETDGIDVHLAKEAHETGKTVIELESAESQLSLFDGFSEELQQLYFHQTVTGAATASIGYKQLLDMWTLGDLKILEAMHDSYVKEGRQTMGDLFDEYDNGLLVSRNEGMVEKIDDYLQSGEAGTYMFAVGSLHMVGEHGLVAQLESKGYTVEFIE